MIVECPGCESRYDVTGRPPGTQARCRCGQTFVLPEPAQSANALRCPQCSGNVETGTSQCQFCEAALLVKACPRCFSRIFHGAVHCDQCGAEVEVPARANPDGSARLLQCPRCDASPAMVARLVGDTLLDECPACHGLWLDSAGVDRLVRERRQVSTQAVLGMGSRKSVDTGVGRAPINPPGRLYVKCPECDTLMNRTNFAKRSGIIIDTCRGHGTWFDADELPRIVEFVMNGGIDEANEANLRRAQEEVRKEKSKVRSMKSAQSAATTTESQRHHSVGLFGDLLHIVGGLL